MPSAAIIDIGSNSIKLLVAQRGEDGLLVALKAHTLDARISAGLSQSPPRLSEAGLTTGLAAVVTLLQDAAPYEPAHLIIVATSAVRDTVNGHEFCQRVEAATGHAVRVLTGEEEANLIGRGLLEDPTLAHLENFHVFDLGGGSLECLTFRRRRVTQAISLPLGCVRLSEQFILHPDAPLTPEVRAAIAAATREALGQSDFAFSLGPEPEAVFMGGTMTTARAILATQKGVTLFDMPALIPLSEIRLLLERLASLPLEERRKVPGLPPARADVFPTALVTTVALAEVAQITQLHHSLYNLRWGLAADCLPEPDLRAP